ncbi:unnamed protein product, partial [marine sediment metagenome]
MKFKVGDIVEVIDEDVDNHLIGMIGKIVKTTTDSKVYAVDFGKKIKQEYNIVNATTHDFCENELTLHKARKGAKNPTHLV